MSTPIRAMYGSPGRWLPDPIVLDPPLKPMRLPDAAVDILRPPLLYEGIAFCVSRPYGLLALDSCSLDVLWNLPTEPAWGACLLHADGLLVVPRPGVLVVLDPRTGVERESQSSGDVTLEYSVISQGHIVTPLEAGLVGAWDVSKAKFAWRVPSRWNLTLLAANDKIVCVTEGHAYVALDLETGVEHWRFDVLEMGRHNTLMHGERPGATVGHPIVTQGQVFAGVTGGWLVCLDASTGAIQWELQVGQFVPRNFMLAPSGELFFLNDDALTVVDSSSGSVRKRQHISGQERINGDGPFSPITITERFVWTVDALGRLLAITRVEPRVYWRYDLGARVGEPLIIADERLFAVDLSGRLTVLAARA